jgi:hypothetical protein
VIGDDGREAAEMTLSMRLLLVGGAKHPVQPAEFTHHAPVKITIVLILCLVDEVKVATEHRGTLAVRTDLSELLQEGNLCIVALRSIHYRNPPWRIGAHRHLGGNGVRGKQGVRDGHIPAPPG